MPLTVTVVGNRAYITGDGFAFTTTLSGTKADITGVGRTVAVDFADPQANVQWSAGGAAQSSSFCCYGDNIYQHHMPGETGHTLGETTALEYWSSNQNDLVFSSVATENYILYCSYLNGANVAYRIHKLEDVNADALVTPAGLNYTRMIAYSDDIFYF